MNYYYIALFFYYVKDETLIELFGSNDIGDIFEKYTSKEIDNMITPYVNEWFEQEIDSPPFWCRK